MLVQWLLNILSRLIAVVSFGTNTESERPKSLAGLNTGVQMYNVMTSPRPYEANIIKTMQGAGIRGRWRWLLVDRQRKNESSNTNILESLRQMTTT